MTLELEANAFLVFTQKLGANPLVLCVEDDQDILQMLVIMLENRGYNVLAADTVEKAVRLTYEHKNIHTLIVDFHIGNQTATDLIKALGNRKPKNVVLLSGKHFANDSQKEVPGIDAHVSKPFNIKHLLDKINIKRDQSVLPVEIR